MTSVLSRARATRDAWAKLICLASCCVSFLASVARGSSEATTTASVKAHFVVAQGKLQLVWETPAPEAALVSLYRGEPAVASIFKARVLAEINARLSALTPLLDWKPAFGAASDQPLRAQLAPTARIEAEAFSGPLRDWLARFAGSSGGTFVHWRPTEPSVPVDASEAAENETIHDSLTSFLVLSATSLIGQISATDLEDNNPLQGTPLRVRFQPAKPIASVRIAPVFEFGMETAIATERVEFVRHHRERTILETELSSAAGGLQLSWSDDLAVQRMMSVARARGWWAGFAQAQSGAPRQVHWLTWDGGQTRAVVHPPHLTYLVFEPDADSDELVAATTAQLLRPRERAAVQEALALQRRFPNPRLAPPDSQPLIRIVQRRDQRRLVDLFALGSYLGARSADGTTRRYSPVPVREEELAERLAQIESHGVLAAATPTGADENRLVPTRNRSRQEFERGGIEIWVSPRAVKNNSDDATGRPVADVANSIPNFSTWIKQQRLRLETGVSLENAEPATFIARVSTIDAIALGRLGAEVRYQERLSGKIEWQPLTRDARPLGLMPSSVSVFSDSPPPRPVDGRTISFVHEGVRVSQRRPWLLDASKPLAERWTEFAAEAARVRDLTPRALPTQDEFSISVGAGFRRAPSVWDARAYYASRVKATATARGRGELDTWINLEAAGQIRVPRGNWSYFGSFDARTVSGTPAPDALPYLGGSEGVRGVRPYAAPARTRIIVRNELWTPVPFLSRDIGSDQKWFRSIYQTLKPALFVDTGWASSLHDPAPTSPWFFGPGAGVRVLLGPAHLSFDYAYGLTRPARLGGHRVSLGIIARY